MDTTIELTEDDIRAAVDRFGVVVPGVSNEKIVENTVAALKGELVLKDAHGMSDKAMEAVYAIAYNEFQAGQFEAAHRLFVFLCMVDHLNKKYWMALGACRFGAQNYPGAAAAYGLAGMLDDCDPTPPLRAADCYLADEDVESAVEALQYGMKLCADKPEYAAGKERAEAILELLATNAKKP